MLQLYDLNKVKIRGLKLYKDYCIESTLTTGDKVLSFLYPSKLSEGIKEEGYIRTKTDEFVIKEIADRGDWKAVKATLNVEDLEGQVFEHFNTTEQTISESLTLALAGTGWTVQVNGVTKKRTIRKTNCSTWEIIQQAKKTYLVEIQFDTINKVIKVAEKFGSDKGVYFMDSLNLRSLDIQSNSYEFYTRLIAIGKGDLKVTVENFQYSNKRKTLIWKDERYTDINALTEDATAKLAEISKPYRAYGADIIDMASTSNKYSILSYVLGDTITLISKEKGIKEKQRIVKVTEYPEEPERNRCEIANTILTFVDIQKQYQEAAETVSNITSDNGTISEGAIRVAVESITINKADIGSLNAAEARIGTLEVTTATITQLNASNARIDNLIATTVTITQLNAASAKIEVLESKAASIDTLVAGNLTAKNMQAGFITAESGLIANGAIKDAMILNLSVSKILAGDISTSKFRVLSDTGNMLIADNTIQIKDSTRVRVQIGKDASNDYNMYVWDAAGNLMFDATGLKSNGIKSKIIRDDMVSDSANIDGKKLNINTVVSSINGATTLLKASKINLDTEAQTLDLAFTSLKGTVASTSNTVTSQGTAITTIQGQISSKIWQQDITTAVDGIQFGGRNLFKIGTVGKYAGGTVSEKSAAISITGYKISVLSNPLDIIGNVIENLGTEIIISGRTNSTSFRSYYKFSNGTQQYVVPTVTNGYFVFKLLVPSGATFLNLGLGEYPYTKPYYIENVKVENGNRASDFTCAPEDTEEKITTINSNYSTLNQTVSTINASVGSLQTTTTDLGTRVSSAEGSINVLKDSITSKVSSSDVTNLINADKTILDTRTSNQPPSWYWSNYPKKTVLEFKYRTTINAPGTTMYGSLTTTVPWSDSSGGSISQVFRSLDGTYERVSTSTTAWSAWKELEDTKGSQDKINAYNTSTVAPLISRISIAESSITQLDNSIKLKVSQTDVETYVNDIFVATKNNGIELINQDYQKGISTGFPFSNSTVVAKVDGQIGGFGMKGTVFSTSSPIPFDVTKPIYVQFNFYHALRTAGRLYIGFEFYNADKVSMGDNSLCYYVVSKLESDIPIGSWQKFEAWLPELTTDTTRNTAKYIRIRILTRWSVGDTTNWVYFKNFSVKQLGGQHLSDTITRVTTAESSIDQMAGQIALKVDVNGVKSTIEQNPDSVKIGFNGISTNIKNEGGEFQIKNGALKVFNTRGNGYLLTGYNAYGDSYVYTQGHFQAGNESGRTLVYPDGTTAVNGSSATLTPYGLAHENRDGRNMFIRSSTNINIVNLSNVMDRALNLFELNGSTIRTHLYQGKRAELWQNCVNATGTTDTNLWLNHSGGGTQVVVGNGAGTGWGKIVAETLYVAGSKNCIQQTKNYGWREMNALETPEYYYCDFGRGTLLDGKCVIWIEDIFSETVNTNMDYHVFVSPYGRGYVWASERNPNYFVVEGDNDIEFSWQFVAKRVGFENIRLELAETQPEPSMEFRQSEEDMQVINESILNEYNIDELNNSTFTDAELNISDLENKNNEILNALMEEWII